MQGHSPGPRGHWFHYSNEAACSGALLPLFPCPGPAFMSVLGIQALGVMIVRKPFYPLNPSCCDILQQLRLLKAVLYLVSGDWDLSIIVGWDVLVIYFPQDWTFGIWIWPRSFTLANVGPMFLSITMANTSVFLRGALLPWRHHPCLSHNQENLLTATNSSELPALCQCCLDYFTPQSSMPGWAHISCIAHQSPQFRSHDSSLVPPGQTWSVIQLLASTVWRDETFL